MLKKSIPLLNLFHILKFHLLSKVYFVSVYSNVVYFISVYIFWSSATQLNIGRMKLSQLSNYPKYIMRPWKWAKKFTLPAPNAETLPTKPAKSVPQVVFSANFLMSRTRNLPMLPANAANTLNSIRLIAACSETFSIYLRKNSLKRVF